jgi:hypothetical protein
MNHGIHMKATVAELRTPVPCSIGDTSGTVLAVLHDDALLVECDGVRLPCRRAFSCLVAPQSGDHVLIGRTDQEPHYVLAILERPVVSETRLRIDGDLLLEATRSVRIRAAQQVHLHGSRLELNADEAELVAGKSSFHCGELQGHVGALRLIGKTLETVMERIVQISKASFRTVEAVDHLRAAHVDHAATESLRLHGKHTLITAERLSKIDAQQIHLG